MARLCSCGEAHGDGEMCPYIGMTPEQRRLFKIERQLDSHNGSLIWLLMAFWRTVIDGSLLNPSPVIKRNFTKFYLSCSIVHNLILTLITKYYAILNSVSTALRYWNSRYCVPSLAPSIFSTSCTDKTINPLIVNFNLPILCSANSNTTKHDNNLPPKLDWRIGRSGEYMLYKDDKKTIAHIHKEIRLWVDYANKKHAAVSSIKLKTPLYRILFSISEYPAGYLHIADTPTLKRAQRIAEDYYIEWLKFNENYRRCQ